MMASITVVVPAYNEEEAVEGTLRGLVRTLKADTGNEYHVVVVNDGSRDETGAILDRIKGELGIEVIHSPENQGYGASLKRGFARRKTDYLFSFDADGQHTASDIPMMVPELAMYDAVIGIRPGLKGSPIWRTPGRWCMARLVNYLCARKIPDFNCGLRGFRRETLEEIEYLCAYGFSFSATSTMALFSTHANVKFVPVKVAERKGKSSVTAGTGMQTLLLIVTSMMRFSPLKIFLPASAACFLAGSGFLVHDLYYRNISDSCVFMFVTGVEFFLIGLVADQIAHLRKEKG
jgi:glycosyltransferase involved in cell wall biosynthesis